MLEREEAIKKLWSLVGSKFTVDNSSDAYVRCHRMVRSIVDYQTTEQIAKACELVEKSNDVDEILKSIKAITEETTVIRRCPFGRRVF